MNSQIEQLKEPPTDYQLSTFCDPISVLMGQLLAKVQTGMDATIIASAMQTAAKRCMVEALIRLYPNDVSTQHDMACKIAKTHDEHYHMGLHEAIHTAAEDKQRPQCPSQLS